MRIGNGHEMCGKNFCFRLERMSEKIEYKAKKSGRRENLSYFLSCPIALHVNFPQKPPINTIYEIAEKAPDNLRQQKKHPQGSFL